MESTIIIASELYLGLYYYIFKYKNAILMVKIFKIYKYVENLRKIVHNIQCINKKEHLGGKG